METIYFIPNKRYRFKLHNEVSENKILKTLFTLSIILILYIPKPKKVIFEPIEIKDKNDFNNILPRIVINEIPSKKEIFKSRVLYTTESK